MRFVQLNIRDWDWYIRAILVHNGQRNKTTKPTAFKK